LADSMAATARLERRMRVIAVLRLLCCVPGLSESLRLPGMVARARPPRWARHGDGRFTSRPIGDENRVSPERLRKGLRPAHGAQGRAVAVQFQVPANWQLVLRSVAFLQLPQLLG
jgi:hypothetical protein